MTLSEYELLERDFLSSSTDIRTFLQQEVLVITSITTGSADPES